MPVSELSGGGGKQERMWPTDRAANSQLLLMDAMRKCGLGSSDLLIFQGK